MPWLPRTPDPCAGGRWRPLRLCRPARMRGPGALARPCSRAPSPWSSSGCSSVRTWPGGRTSATCAACASSGWCALVARPQTELYRPACCRGLCWAQGSRAGWQAPAQPQQPAGPAGAGLTRGAAQEPGLLRLQGQPAAGGRGRPLPPPPDLLGGAAPAGGPGQMPPCITRQLHGCASKQALGAQNPWPDRSSPCCGSDSCPESKRGPAAGGAEDRGQGLLGAVLQRGLMPAQPAGHRFPAAAARRAASRAQAAAAGGQPMLPHPQLAKLEPCNAAAYRNPVHR